MANTPSFNTAVVHKGSNSERTVLASVARTATVSSADFDNDQSRGLHVVVDVTSITLTPSVVFVVEGKDPVSGKYYALITSAAITATGTTILTVYPGITTAANTKVSDVLPKTYRVTATHADTDSITYSVSGSLVV